uniref:Ribosome biogenesis protein NOP53 n=1 Tax=Strongyloides stercoralis TaxID=6248 RepID=A0A0K0DV50_STRER
MGKRKHSEDEVNGSFSEIHEPKKKSRKVTLNEEDEYDVWIVCKPQSVSTDILNDLKFPKSIREKHTSIEKVENDETILHKCDFRVLENQISILEEENPKKNEVTSIDLNVKYQVKGIVNITCSNNISDGFYMPPEEDFMNLDRIVNHESFPFTIKRINKKPQLKLDSLKQRLKAFGSITKKGKKKNKVPKREVVLE